MGGGEVGYVLEKIPGCPQGAALVSVELDKKEGAMADGGGKRTVTRTCCRRRRIQLVVLYSEWGLLSRVDERHLKQ
jgi:hypothetical protein